MNVAERHSDETMNWSGEESSYMTVRETEGVQCGVDTIGMVESIDFMLAVQTKTTKSVVSRIVK